MYFYDKYYTMNIQFQILKYKIPLRFQSFLFYVLSSLYELKKNIVNAATLDKHKLR